MPSIPGCAGPFANSKYHDGLGNGKKDEIGLFRASAYKSGNHDSRSSGGGKFLAETENVKYVLVLAEAKWS